MADQLVDSLGSLWLFADLDKAELERVVHTFDEEWYPEGQRVLRQGFSGTGFYVILDGEADVVADGQKLATLARGDFFGEVSVLLGEPPTADIVATRPLRCIVIGGPGVESFLTDHPRVMYRMLQASARRLRNANRRLTASQ